MGEHTTCDLDELKESIWGAKGEVLITGDLLQITEMVTENTEEGLY